jgi:NADPH:quinone reductase-like Zn-dependent oxidoreductase
LTFDQASTIPLGFTTAAIGLYQEKRDRGGAGLVAPWAKGGRGKYAEQAIYIPGGSSSVGQYGRFFPQRIKLDNDEIKWRLALQLAKLSGFNPIITTASAYNEEYCRAAGATHIVDYRITPYASIPTVVKGITKGPVEVIFDAISTQESQKADLEILDPNGSLVLTLPPAIDKLTEPQGNLWVVQTLGSVRDNGHSEFGTAMYTALPGLLAEGSIKVCSIVV